MVYSCMQINCVSICVLDILWITMLPPEYAIYPGNGFHKVPNKECSFKQLLAMGFQRLFSEQKKKEMQI